MAGETLPYVYTSQAEIKEIWSTVAADDRLNDPPATSPLANVLNDTINEATDTVNMYVQGYYIDSLLTTSALVRRWTSYIACHLISIRRGDPGQYTAEYERILETLDKIRQGIFQIPRLPVRDDMTPAMSNYTVDNRFSFNKIRVVPSISTGGTYPNQDVDISLSGGGTVPY